jgi:hypothetical protein
MSRRVTGFVATVATTLILMASPVWAIGPSFFQNYVSAGAVVLQVANPFGTAVISVNYRPADFSPAEASAINAALWAVVTGVTIQNSFSPADIAAAGISPVQVIQALQEVRVDPFTPVTRMIILDLYRGPSGIKIDMYDWFARDDFRYVITLGS